jgi:hypothetical protein
MRKFVLGLTAALLVVAVPVGAQEATEPEPTAPCEAPEQGEIVGLAGAATDVDMPLLPGIVHHDVLEEPYDDASVTRFAYRFDVSGSETVPNANAADLVVDLSWGNDSEFDLHVRDASTGAILAESTKFNPLDGTGELATATRLAHCTDVIIEVVNYIGVASDLHLKLSATRLRAPVV